MINTRKFTLTQLQTLFGFHLFFFTSVLYFSKTQPRVPYCLRLSCLIFLQLRTVPSSFPVLHDLSIFEERWSCILPNVLPFGFV